MAKTGLEEFREIITDIRSLTSWAVNTAVVAPLADFILKIGAPWPVGVPIITSLVELITFIGIFQFWSRKSQKFSSRVLIISFFILVLSFFSYLYLFDSYTFVNPATQKRYTKGFLVKPEIQEMIPDYFKNPDQALAGSEYKEEEIWEPNSITAARLVLLLNWLILFISLSIFIGTFVMAQRRKRVRTPN
jgi:hypothetical protein